MALSLSGTTQRQRHQFLKLASLARTSKAVLQTASEAQQAQAALLDDFFPSYIQQEAVAKPLQGLIDFKNPETVFAKKSTRSLLQSYAVLKACQLKPLVHNAEALLRLSKSLIGSKTTSRLVEATFFKQFCAGTNGETIQPTLRYLRERGILPILNYAAESDVGEADGGKAFTSLSEEAALDRQQRVFMRSIADCDNTRPSRGFVGIKLTGLARPEILERMSGVLVEEGAPLDRGHSSAGLRRVMAARLNPEEFQGFDNLMTRVEALATTVYEKGHMRMLVDAEQTYLQPAIDAVTIALQQKFNRKGAVVMNTYQCYLKDSAGRIEADLRRSFKEGWKWGAKTVRGAYMHQERALAEERSCDSPIHDSLADTHANYDSCVEHVLEHVASGSAELMVASHNQASIERALVEMQLRGIHPNSPRSGMYFGQLLGMADHLTFPLGSRGYNAYKICAYGSVEETTAFLLRRVLENSDMLGGCAREVSLVRSELIRRLVASSPRLPVLNPV